MTKERMMRTCENCGETKQTTNDRFRYYCEDCLKYYGLAWLEDWRGITCEILEDWTNMKFKYEEMKVDRNVLLILLFVWMLIVVIQFVIIWGVLG